MLRELAAAVFPLACPGCGRPGDPVCAACAPRLRRAPIAAPPVGVDAWAAAFVYDDVARELVARLKYRGAHAATAWLAREMALLAAIPLSDLVTWVPTTTRRRRERGFDHAELLARQVARGVGRPVRSLLRRVDDQPQTGLPASARRHGPTLVARRCAPSSVLLVDDVTTTGATLVAAAAALRAGGATRITVLTAARTPPPQRLRRVACAPHGDGPNNAAIGRVEPS